MWSVKLQSLVAWWWQLLVDRTKISTHTKQGQSDPKRHHREYDHCVSVEPWLSGLDGKQRGCPVCLPHCRLKVTWSQRRRCDSVDRVRQKEGRQQKLEDIKHKSNLLRKRTDSFRCKPFPHKVWGDVPIHCKNSLFSNKNCYICQWGKKIKMFMYVNKCY